jgi:hypothetical protein
MQFPAQNAHPFEFARPVLLLTGFAFFLGFGGYLAVNPAKTAATPPASQSAAAQPAPAHAVTSVSAPAGREWTSPKKI